MGDQRRQAVHHQRAAPTSRGFVTITARDRRRRDLEHPRPERHAGLRGRRGLPQDGLERLRHAAARFDDCRVPEENLLGPRGQGFKQFLQTLDGGRIGVAAMGVGLAQGALDEALAYAKERRRSASRSPSTRRSRPSSPTCRPRSRPRGCSPTRRRWRRTRARTFSLTAAQAKLKTGRLAVRAAEEAVQIHGGYGYIEEYPVCRFYRDAKILTIGEGTDEVQQMVIARRARAAEPRRSAPTRRSSLAPASRVYAATLGLHAFGASDYGGDEPHYLLAAEVARRRRRRRRARRVRRARLRRLLPLRARPRTAGSPRGGCNEPHGVGLPAADRARLRARRARRGRAVPRRDRRARGRARLPARAAGGARPVGASARRRGRALARPSLAYGTAVYPELTAGAALAGAALLALRARRARHARRRLRLLRPARPAALARDEVRARRPRGRLLRRPRALARAPADARDRRRRARRSSASPSTSAERGALRRAHPLRRRRRRRDRHRRRLPRRLPRARLPRWSRCSSTATTACCAGRRSSLLAFAGLWWLWRSRRERLARALPACARPSSPRGLCAAALGAQLLVAAFLAPTMFGFWFPPRHLWPRCRWPSRWSAWGCATRRGRAACSALLTLVASAWLYADVRFGGGALVTDRPDAPFGPLTELFPLFDSGGGWPYALAGAIARRCAVLLRPARAPPLAPDRRRHPRAGTPGSARTTCRVVRRR